MQLVKKEINVEMQVHNVFEPNRIKLIWQNAFNERDRTNYHVADIIKKNDTVFLSYTCDTEDFLKARELGFEGYSKFKFDSAPIISHIDVGNTFYRRLPPRSRGDFLSYLSGFGLKNHEEISSFALLGYTGATLPGDSFYCLHYYEDMPIPSEFVMHVAGFRHVRKDNIESYSDILSNHEELTPRLEPENEHDSSAIALYHDDEKIGYINRNSTSAFKNWMENNQVKILSYRINGTASKPRLLAFVSIK